MKKHYIYLVFLYILFIFSASYSQIITDFRVNDVQGNIGQGSSSIAVDNNGNFLITWEDLRNGKSNIYAQRYSSDGIKLGGNFRVNVGSDTTTRKFNGGIAVDADGNFVITWMEGHDIPGNRYGDIYAQRYSSDGVILGNNFKVSDSLGIGFFPTISSDFNGNFVIAWGDERNGGYGNSDIYAQRYSSNGIAIGDNFRVNDDNSSTRQYDPCIATDSCGNYVITWYDTRNGEYDIYAQRYLSDGTPLSGNFKVNDGHLSWHDGPSISTDENGNFVIVWTNNILFGYGKIYAQRFSDMGVAQGDNFKVSGDLETCAFSSVSSNANGNFVITWVALQSGIETIYAQRYLSDGSKFGDNYRVNSNDTALTFGCCTDFLSDRIYTTWTTGNDIWANVLDWNSLTGLFNEKELNILRTYQLAQNYPNPFNPNTTIQYTLPNQSIVSLKLYDVLGSEVSTLVNEIKEPGTNKINFDATNLPSGVYFYRLQAGDPSTGSGQVFVGTKKMVLLK